MSHVVRLKEVRILRPDLLKRVAQELGLDVQENIRLGRFSTEKSQSGMSVQLLGWRIPVCIADDGTVVYDNWEGRWGDVAELHRLIQRYSIALVYEQAAQSGQWVQQEERQDGTVVLRIGGGW